MEQYHLAERVACCERQAVWGVGCLDLAIGLGFSFIIDDQLCGPALRAHRSLDGCNNVKPLSYVHPDIIETKHVDKCLGQNRSCRHDVLWTLLHTSLREDECGKLNSDYQLLIRELPVHVSLPEF